MSAYDLYEPVIGLEVHIQLNTQSKAFSSDSASYGADPNTQVSPITLGHPGTLPRFNEQTLEYAVLLGLATKSQIREWNEFARKNYFYADLPKGYQITQHTTPICTGGQIHFRLEDGSEKVVHLTRIHMEEDAGKSMHDQDIYDSLVDLNRCGVPLLEIVSEPDIRSAQEAYLYLTEIRKLVRYLGICDGNMEEGSLRCDANISVRKKGEAKFGTKVEVKNMNSFNNVRRAIEHEIIRQIDLLESGQSFTSETRSFNAENGTTFALRSKEEANDYRYFPEPDLQPVVVNEAYISQIATLMPPLPHELYARYTKEWGLSDFDARNLTDDKSIALYFNELSQLVSTAKSAANWMMGPVKSWLNQEAKSLNEFPMSPSKLAELIALVESGKVSHSVAAQRLFPELILQPKANPQSLAESLNLIMDSDEEGLKAMVDEILAAWPEKVAEFKAGKKGVLGLFMGELMKKSKGKADPKTATQLFNNALNA